MTIHPTSYDARSGRTRSNEKTGRSFRWIWWARLIVLALSVAGVPELQAQTVEQETGVWGNIEYYTDGYAMVSGKRYEYSKTTTMDTYSLKPDKRGTVRVVLDPQGRVARLYFYGIDMPQVVKQYKR